MTIRIAPCTFVVLIPYVSALSLFDPNSCRRAVLRGLVGLGYWQGETRTTLASETIGKDPTCNNSSCLSVWDGILADCPHSKIRIGGGGCVSSQDDTPGVFAEPWDYSDSESLGWEDQMGALLNTIELVSTKRGDTVEYIMHKGRYCQVLFIDHFGERSTGEFFFTPNDTTVQFRIAGSTNGISSIQNKERAEMIRKQLRYLKLPVLRNRKQSLLFVESDYDSFGPGSASLRPPSEMRLSDLDGGF